MKFVSIFVSLIVAATVAVQAESVLKDFVTVRGDQLFEGDKPFRFISWNIPNLQMVEDNFPAEGINPWRLPDQFELTDALSTVRLMGGTVVRTYVLSVMRTNDAPGTPRHVLGPGKFNEEAFRALDIAMQAANEQGVRLIIPFVDNWVWQGGRAEYCGFRGIADREQFWTDPQVIADFKETVKFLVLRTNTVTGTRYCDDKALLCWETGNELSCPPSWTREIAGYIKSLDTNHLVMDGVNASELKPSSLEMREVDIVTTHHYPGPKKPFAQFIRENAAKAKGRKPYVVGEFGFVSTDKMEDAMNAIMDTGISGGLLWSLRFRNRDGGFYWHSEPAGGNLYKAFHWPGSPIGSAYDEAKLMAMVRSNAFAIRGMTQAPIPAPAPPKLLLISDAAAITWQGSVGAASYTVERAPKATGPWSVAGGNVDESFVQYRPLFADESVTKGDWYYRVRAVNEAGTSEPSNIFGPVAVARATLVDELADFSKVSAQQGKLEIKMRDSRQAREDAHRAAGKSGDALVYKLPTSIEGFRVFAFFPKEIADLKFTISSDGKTFHDAVATKESYFHGGGDYGYWKPVMYQARDLGNDAKFIKIELTGETQIGRVEITHALE